MARKEIIEEIKKLQHELGMTLQELKAFMYAETGTEKVQKISDENLSMVRYLLRVKANAERVEVPGTVTSPGEELEVLGTPGAVVPVITEKEAIEHFQRFQRIKKAVLTEKDYMYIGKDGKPCEFENRVSEYIKKSGWRKIALLFNLTIEQEDLTRFKGVDNDGDWHGIGIKVRAIAPNGRFVEAAGTCTTRNPFFCKRWDADKKESRWIDTDESNLIKTAQTVAINRAISDLVGSGELSAEEVE